MVERILFGKRSAGQYGVYISVPGKSVLTAAPDELLLSTDLVRVFQYVTQGTYSPTTDISSFNIAIPDLGFKPGVLWGVAPGFSDAERNNGIALRVDISYPSSTVVRFSMENPYRYKLNYGVTNLPVTAY